MVVGLLDVLHCVRKRVNNNNKRRCVKKRRRRRGVCLRDFIIIFLLFFFILLFVPVLVCFIVCRLSQFVVDHRSTAVV